jgi:hypothetical protein
MRFFACAALLGGLVTAAYTQSPPPALVVDFPPDAKPLAADALQQRLTGKVFHVERADGNHWRLQYQGSGYYFINTSRGFNDSGKWRVEDSKLCAEPQKTPAGCSETRLLGESLYVKRAVNGEVIKLEQR